MEGVGGGAQEITWQRYNGERRAKFSTGDRTYEDEYGDRDHRRASSRPAPLPAPSPPPAAPAPPPPPAPAPPTPAVATSTEIKITDTRVVESSPSPRAAPPPSESRQRSRREKMWTELTKDLVIREAILERGYEFEETEDHFYVIEYLKYVSFAYFFAFCSPPPPVLLPRPSKGCPPSQIQNPIH
jgi:hypothetical protein